MAEERTGEQINQPTYQPDMSITGKILSSEHHSMDPIGMLKRIYDRALHGIICIDQEHRIVSANKSAQDTLEFHEEELINLHVGNIFRDPGAYDRMLAEPVKTPQSDTFVETLSTKHGQKVDAKISLFEVSSGQSQPRYRLITLHMVADRKRVLDTLRLQRRMFRLMADNSYNWEVWSQPDGRCMYVSPSCERICGHGPDEFLEDPKLFDKLVFTDDREIWKNHLDCNTPEAGRRELQIRITRRDGEVRWIEHRCQAVIDEQGTLLGFRASNQDITLRKKYEVELHQSLAKIEHYRDELAGEQAYEHAGEMSAGKYPALVGSSSALQYIFFKIDQVADTDTTVLLLGETGTGKGLIASALHQASRRAGHKLVTVDCTSIPATMMENQLFGHEKGSFTSAHDRQIGSFERAQGGTLFFDEIGDLPLELQAKLLRVLQEREFERVGGSRTIKADVRIIAATNRNLEDDVKKGLFRQDLWYRLNVFPITAPPLRDRPDDIPALAVHFTGIYAELHGRPVPTIPNKVMGQLQDYPWPGNVRELKNVIERAVLASSRGKLHLADPLAAPPAPLKKRFPTLAEVERHHIMDVLEATNWKVSGSGSAAEILGMKRSTLRARMDKYNISKP